MNEIIRIHIAGVPYEIDVDARKQLNKYLDAIKDSLGTDSDCLDDIEIRITEILSTRGIDKNDVIKLTDVAAIKDQLGQPKDFSSDEAKKDEKIADKIRTTIADKKYFRDTENSIAGGVVAGFAAYTGWDVTLLRILLVILCLATAFFPLAILYIIAWICAPEAKTASDHLSMKGQPINIETLKETAEDIADKTGKTAQKAADKVKSSAPTALRVVLGFFGVIGLLIFIPCLIAIIPITILGIMRIATATIIAKPLFIATAILTAVLLFTLFSAGITASTALIAARLNKSARISLVLSMVFVFFLSIASSVTGGIWYSYAGNDGAIDAANQLIPNLNIETDDHNGVKLDLGPLHIDTRHK